MQTYSYIIGTTWSSLVPSQMHIQVANELARRGHKVVLLVGENRTDVEDHGANPAIYTWPSRRPTGWQDFRFIYGLLGEYRPDCVLSDGYGSRNLMLLAGWLRGVPCRATWYHVMRRQLRLQTPRHPRWKERLLVLRRQILQGITKPYFIANSRASRLDLLEHSRVSPDRVYPFRFFLRDPLSNGDLPPPGDRRRVVCVGRLEGDKSQDTLIRAAALLKEEFPDLVVEFVGEGPLEEDYRRLAREVGASEVCQFVGRLPHREVFRRMAAATVCVLPSLTEAFGIVNIESLAVGTPVIASHTDGIVEIIRDGQDGFLFPPGDYRALAEGLHRLLSDPDLRARMSRSARERFLAEYEIGRNIYRFADLLERMVADAGRREKG
ncbi:MAG TPA: glycosyltransferase family 1 protein [Chloroflexi bacterium]|nr:glycosyltransferase family 1 protein [Chloroflexota bacterium]